MNVPSYFLIVLGGFAIVWGFRWAKYSGKEKPALGEFEYAALSAIWGSLFLLIGLNITTLAFHWPPDSRINAFLLVPFVATPFIVLVGGALGAFIGWLFSNKK